MSGGKKGRKRGAGKHVAVRASLRTEEEVHRASSDSDFKAPFRQRKSHIYAFVASAPTLRTHLKYIHILSLTLTFAVIGRGRSFRSVRYAALGMQSFVRSPYSS